MAKRMFYDETTESVISFEDVQRLYKEAIENGYTDESFSVWFELVQAYNNGTLTEVYKFSMTVWNEETERYEDIVAIGSNPKNAIVNYSIDNDISEYPIIVSSRKIDF